MPPGCSPPWAAAGPLPPSPGAAAGGRMEQGLSAITLYCAPAAGPAAAACAMEPEQVSGAGPGGAASASVPAGPLRRGAREEAASGGGRGPRAAAAPGSGRGVGGGRGLSARGVRERGEPPARAGAPLWAGGGVRGARPRRRGGRSVCASVCPSGSL